jgi:hypothetical protein
MGFLFSRLNLLLDHGFLFTLQSPDTFSTHPIWITMICLFPTGEQFVVRPNFASLSSVRISLFCRILLLDHRIFVFTPFSVAFTFLLNFYSLFGSLTMEFLSKWTSYWSGVAVGAEASSCKSPVVFFGSLWFSAELIDPLRSCLLGSSCKSIFLRYSPILPQPHQKAYFARWQQKLLHWLYSGFWAIPLYLQVLFESHYWSLHQVAHLRRLEFVFLWYFVILHEFFQFNQIRAVQNYFLVVRFKFCVKKYVKSIYKIRLEYVLCYWLRVLI